MTASDPCPSRDYLHLFIRLSVGNLDVFGRVALPLGRGTCADSLDGSIFCKLLAGAEICEPAWMEFAGAWRDFGHRADQSRHAASVEAVVVRAHRVVRSGCFLSCAVVGWVAEMVWRRGWRACAEIRDGVDIVRRGERGRVVDAEYCMEERLPHKESSAFHGDDGWRR